MHTEHIGIEILTRYKAYNAANLDGGSSSELVINKFMIIYKFF